jgi:hypothetical protein
MNSESIQQLYTKLPDAGAERLERYLDRCNTGFSCDLRTPLYKEAPREEAIERFRQLATSTGYAELDAIDTHEEGKIGPYSIMLPYKELIPTVEAYFSQHWDPDMDGLRYAFSHVVSKVPSRSLRPMSFQNAKNAMPKGTSLGCPWVTSDVAYADLYLQRAVKATSVTEFYPDIKYWRGQPKGLKEIPKQRVVWGKDHMETIIGATILYPVLEVLKRVSGFSAWLGSGFVDAEATALLTQAHGRRIYSIDYSSFDSSLTRGLLDLVDQVLITWFTVDATARIKLLGEVNATSGLIVPFEVLVGRNGGMPSGSVLTNLRDTLANLLAGYYCAYRLDVDLDQFMVLGDDGVFLFSDDVSELELSQVMAELGLTCNSDKQFISTRSIHYLQRWHSLDYLVQGVCVGAHSPYRTLSGMLGYERWKNGWNKFMDSARWIMQVEVCSWHPLFKQLVRFLFEGDDVLYSGIDPVDIFLRAGGSPKVRDVLNIASFPFNVKDPDKVREFRTTTELRLLQGR